MCKRDVVKDLPTHLDLMRCADQADQPVHPRGLLNHEKMPRAWKRVALLTIVRQEVELKWLAG